MCVCVCVCVCAGNGGVSPCTRARGSVLTNFQMGTADAEMLSTQHFETLSLDDVHLDGFMYLIISSQPGNSYGKRLICCCVSCYVCDVCRLSSMLFFFFYHLSTTL